jgi:hypothetical protein
VSHRTPAPGRAAELGWEHGVCVDAPSRPLVPCCPSEGWLDEDDDDDVPAVPDGYSLFAGDPPGDFRRDVRDVLDDLVDAAALAVDAPPAAELPFPEPAVLEPEPAVVVKLPDVGVGH